MLVLKKFARDKAAVLGLAIILASLFVAVFGPALAPFPDDAHDTNILARLQPPSAEHWFGTDSLGRDVLSRTILGTRSAMIIALTVVFGAACIGVPLGLIAGYFGGIVGEVLMRTTDVFLAIPQLVLALALAQILGPSLESALMALTLTYWPFFTRIVYAETRRLKTSLFIDALHCLGASSFRTIVLHILPNAMSPIIVRMTIGMGFTILMAAVLGFLGMGEAPPHPDWGLSIAEAREFLPDAWWAATFPGLAILFAVLGFNLFGDGVRDILDPRLRRSS